MAFPDAKGSVIHSLMHLRIGVMAVLADVSCHPTEPPSYLRWRRAIGWRFAREILRPIVVLAVPVTHIQFAGFVTAIPRRPLLSSIFLDNA